MLGALPKFSLNSLPVFSGSLQRKPQPGLLKRPMPLFAAETGDQVDLSRTAKSTKPAKLTPEQILAMPPQAWLKQPKAMQGKNIELVTPHTNPTYFYWQTKILDMVKEVGLDPFPTKYYVANMEKMASIIGRIGMPARMSHWSYGQDAFKQYASDRNGLGRVYELVINSDPCLAYLLENNSVPINQLVMAHVYGHNHFFKYNPAFAETNRNMDSRMADFSYQLENIVTKQKSPTREEMEVFLDKVFSMEQMIDHSERSGRPLQVLEYSLQDDKPQFELPDDYGHIKDSSLPRHILEAINPHSNIQEKRAAAEKEMAEEGQRTPISPDRDVMAYIIENSTVLKPWQRNVAANYREELYYFSPQRKTKVMNEGFATITHRAFMFDNRMGTLAPTELSVVNGGVMAAQPGRFNPYLLGFTMYDVLKRKWDKGQHGPEWEAIKDPKAKAAYDDHSMKGWEKVLDVVKTCASDVEFIRNYLTKEVIDELISNYVYPSKQEIAQIKEQIREENPDATEEQIEDFLREKNMLPPIVNEAYVEQEKRNLIRMLENGGQPNIEVINGNYKEAGELLLKHVYTYDLKMDDTLKVLSNVQDLWGRPVHLDTLMTERNDAILAMIDKVPSDRDWWPNKNKPTSLDPRVPELKKMVMKDRGLSVRWSVKSDGKGGHISEGHILNSEGKPFVTFAELDKFLSSYTASR